MYLTQKKIKKEMKEKSKERLFCSFRSLKSNLGKTRKKRNTSFVYLFNLILLICFTSFIIILFLLLHSLYKNEQFFRLIKGKRSE